MTKEEWEKVRKLKFGDWYLRGGSAQKFIDEMFNRGCNWNLTKEQEDTLKSLSKIMLS